MTPTMAEAFEATREDAQLESEMKRLQRLIVDAESRGSTGPSSVVALFTERIADVRAERARVRGRFGL